MIIKKQPIISWLLHDKDGNNVGIPILSNFEHYGYLHNGLMHLNEIRKESPNWGLPELLMPSFVEVMEKTAKSFFNIVALTLFSAEGS